MYVYIQTESNPDLFTVGFYQVDGKFFAESDYTTPEKAAERVAWINGSKVVSYDPDAPMDKYENYAVGHYLSCWPETMTFTDLMQTMRMNNEEMDQEIWLWEMIEGIPLEDVANMIERMVAGLRTCFPNG